MVKTTCSLCNERDVVPVYSASDNRIVCWLARKKRCREPAIGETQKQVCEYAVIVLTRRENGKYYMSVQ